MNNGENMGKMLWGGRFEKSPKEAVFDYMSAENATLDSRLIKYDILGSMAHVQMLSFQGILKKGEANEILKALKKVLEMHEKGEFKLKKELEDVHMNVENEVTKITPLGKKMHTARSRNDQIALDMRLYLRDEILEVEALVIGLQEAFAKLGKTDVPMPSYTHTRVAQPIMSSFWCESYVQSLGRDLERLNAAYEKANLSPLGACAVSGTGWNIDRKKTAALLGFNGILENEMDTINARGELEAEIVFALAEIMAKLSKFAEESIWFSEMGLIEVGDEFTTGSSIMPNKKNLDIMELLRGRCGRVYGLLMHILSVQKGLISGYNSDMQETKYAVMSALDTAKESLRIATDFAPTIEFNEEKMAEEIKKGYANATEIADALAMNGLPFREAHEKAGKLVADLIKEGKFIEDLSPKELNAKLGSKLSEDVLKKAVSLRKGRLSKKISVNASWKDKIKKEKEKLENAFAKL